MNVSLTPRLEQFIKHQVESGLYGNASEVIREALRLMVRRDGVVRTPAAPGTAALRDSLSALHKLFRDKGIVSVALFGSVARQEAGPSSDIDILIEVDPDSRFSLLDLADLKLQMEAHLERPVDLVTREGLDPAVRANVLRDAQPLFP